MDYSVVTTTLFIISTFEEASGPQKTQMKVSDSVKRGKQFLEMCGHYTFVWFDSWKVDILIDLDEIPKLIPNEECTLHEESKSI